MDRLTDPTTVPHLSVRDLIVELSRCQDALNGGAHARADILRAEHLIIGELRRRRGEWREVTRAGAGTGGPHRPPRRQATRR